MSQLIYVVNNKTYFLFELPMTNKSSKLLTDSIKKYNGICQGIKEVKRTWLNTSYATLSILIPEESVFNFQNEYEVSL